MKFLSPPVQGYLLGFAVFWLTGLAMYLPFEHGHWVLLLNEYHAPTLDVLFATWTHTGSTLFFVGVAGLHLIIKFRKGLVLALIGISVLAVSKFLKQVVFSDTLRPSRYFGDTVELVNVPGSEHVGLYAFPSGHSMAAFALATFFAASLQRRWASSLLLAGAILCGISRVYLGQHFLVDVLGGSLLGLLLSLVFLRIFQDRFKAPGLA